jgi:hypothetical protein
MRITLKTQRDLLYSPGIQPGEVKGKSSPPAASKLVYVTTNKAVLLREGELGSACLRQEITPKESEIRKMRRGRAPETY